MSAIEPRTDVAWDPRAEDKRESGLLDGFLVRLGHHARVGDDGHVREAVGGHERADRRQHGQGLGLVGWNYPEKGNLEELIADANLHPLTALTTLSQVEKHALLGAGLILCKDVKARADVLTTLGIDAKKIPAVMEEIESVCS